MLCYDVGVVGIPHSYNNCLPAGPLHEITYVDMYRYMGRLEQRKRSINKRRGVSCGVKLKRIDRMSRGTTNICKNIR